MRYNDYKETALTEVHTIFEGSGGWATIVQPKVIAENASKKEFGSNISTEVARAVYLISVFHIRMKLRHKLKLYLA